MMKLANFELNNGNKTIGYMMRNNNNTNNQNSKKLLCEYARILASLSNLKNNSIHTHNDNIHHNHMINKAFLSNHKRMLLHNSQNKQYHPLFDEQKIYGKKRRSASGDFESFAITSLLDDTIIDNIPESTSNNTNTANKPKKPQIISPFTQEKNTNNTTNNNSNLNNDHHQQQLHQYQQQQHQHQQPQHQQNPTQDQKPNKSKSLKFRRKSCYCKWCGGISTLELKVSHLPSVIPDHNNANNNNMDKKDLSIASSIKDKIIRNFSKKKKKTDFFSVARAYTNSVFGAQKKSFRSNTMNIFKFRGLDNLPIQSPSLLPQESQELERPNIISDSMNMNNNKVLSNDKNNLIISTPVTYNCLEFLEQETSNNNEIRENFSELQKTNSRKSIEEHENESVLNKDENQPKEFHDDSMKISSKNESSIRSSPSKRGSEIYQSNKIFYKQIKYKNIKPISISLARARLTSEYRLYHHSNGLLGDGSSQNLNENENKTNSNNAMRGDCGNDNGVKGSMSHESKKYEENNQKEIKNRKSLKRSRKPKVKTKSEGSNSNLYLTNNLTNLAISLAEVYTPKKVSSPCQSTKLVERAFPKKIETISPNGHYLWSSYTTMPKIMINHGQNTLQGKQIYLDPIVKTPKIAKEVVKDPRLDVKLEKEKNCKIAEKLESTNRLMQKISNDIISNGKTDFHNSNSNGGIFSPISERITIHENQYDSLKHGSLLPSPTARLTPSRIRFSKGIEYRSPSIKTNLLFSTKSNEMGNAYGFYHPPKKHKSHQCLSKQVKFS